MPECKNRFGRLAGTGALTLFSLFAAFPAHLAAQNPKPDLGSLSLDTLANTEITSVSRKKEKLSQAAAAVFVISQEDIRRSGLSSIPELLRMVPGLTVAQVDANTWAVTARGFNEVLADKLLVLMDGRTVYDPLSSGVHWDIQDTILEDVERIEVIRGPGATLWGANAVNGVVNIITKSAKETQGGLITGGGSQEGEAAAVRYGGALGSWGNYRIFTKYIRQDAFPDALGQESNDDWRLLHGGFRTDLKLSSHDDLTVIGDIYKGHEGQSVPGLLSLSPPVMGSFDTGTNMSGGDLLGRWHRTSSERLDTTVQMYFETADRSEIQLLGEYRHTIDLDFEQHFTASDRHDLVWGGDYRYATDNTIGSLNLSFNPSSRSTNLYGAFLQDSIALVPDRLKVTVGTKLEHNYYSGFAVQPNIRMMWTIRPSYAIWMAISRASENSSRFDADIRVNESASVGANGLINLDSSFGTHHIPPENVLAYELGQRGEVSKWMTFDAAVFYNHYTNRHTQEPGTPFLESDPAPTHLVTPTITMSNISGETHGIELFSQFKITSFWNLAAGYSLFEIHLHAAPGSQDFTTASDSEGSSPRHAFQIRSQVNLPHRLELDTAVYFTGRLAGPQIPDYARVDARLGWHPTKRLEFSLGGQNLLDPRHAEFGSGDFINATQVGRNAYGKFTWRF